MLWTLFSASLRKDCLVYKVFSRLYKSSPDWLRWLADVSESNIHQIFLARQLHNEHHVIKHLAELPEIGVVVLGRDDAHGEAELLQEPGEAAIELVTPAASLVCHDLLVQRLVLDHLLPVSEVVQVLEGDTHLMEELEPGQAGQGHLHWALISNSIKILLHVHLHLEGCQFLNVLWL